MRCSICDLTFSSEEDKIQHFLQVHFLGQCAMKEFDCAECELYFDDTNQLLQHINKIHHFSLSNTTQFQVERFGFKNVLVELINKNQGEKIDSSLYMKGLLPQIISEVTHILNTTRMQQRLRMQICLDMKFEKTEDCL